MDQLQSAMPELRREQSSASAAGYDPAPVAVCSEVRRETAVLCTGTIFRCKKRAWPRPAENTAGYGAGIMAFL